MTCKNVPFYIYTQSMMYVCTYVIFTICIPGDLWGLRRTASRHSRNLRVRGCAIEATWINFD